MVLKIDWCDQSLGWSKADNLHSVTFLNQTPKVELPKKKKKEKK
jgi:hypothetical protein